LQHHPDAVAVLRIEGRGEELQRLLGIRRLLHVEARERAVLPGAVDDRGGVLHAQRFRDVEAHLRELDRNVRVGLGRVNQVQGVQVDVAGGPGVGGARDRFSEQVEARGDPRGVEIGERRDGTLDGFPRHEPRRELPRQPVAPDEAKNLRLLAEPE